MDLSRESLFLLFGMQVHATSMLGFPRFFFEMAHLYEEKRNYFLYKIINCSHVSLFFFSERPLTFLYPVEGLSTRPSKNLPSRNEF